MSDAPVPPNDLDAEQSVIGSILLDGKKAVMRVAAKLKFEHFYRESNGLLYRAALRLVVAGKPIDNVTLASELEAMGALDRVGGRAVLGSIQAGVPTAANVAYYADIVIEKAQKRGIASLGHELVRVGMDDAVGATEAIGKAQSGLFEIAKGRAASEFTSAGDAILENERRYDAMSRGEWGGTPSGFRSLDDLTGGLWPGDLFVVTGRPAMGKTSLAMNIATNVALRGQPVGIFSLEMTTEQLVERMVCSEASIDSRRLQKGLLDEFETKRFTDATGRLGDSPLFINDDPIMDESGIMLAARQFVTRHAGTALLVLDYIQLVRGAAEHKGEKVREVAGIANALKEAARECEVPVLAISQLNRANEHRPDKRPILADLGWSGQIEADADVVVLIHRPDYYKSNEKPGLAELNVTKQRRGPTATVDVRFVRKYTRFEEVE